MGNTTMFWGRIKWVKQDNDKWLKRNVIYKAYFKPFNQEMGKSMSGRKGMVDIFNEEGILVKNYYYPDESLFLIMGDNLKGLEKEIDDLSCIGYRNG